MKKKEMAKEKMSKIIEKVQITYPEIRILETRISGKGNVIIVSNAYADLVINPNNERIPPLIKVKGKTDHFTEEFEITLPGILNSSHWHHYSFINNIQYTISEDRKTLTLQPILKEGRNDISLLPKTITKNIESDKDTTEKIKEAISSFHIEISNEDGINKSIILHLKKLKERISVLTAADKKNIYNPVIGRMIGSEIPEKILTVVRLEEIKLTELNYTIKTNFLTLTTNCPFDIIYDLEKETFSIKGVPSKMDIEKYHIACKCHKAYSSFLYEVATICAENGMKESFSYKSGEILLEIITNTGSFQKKAFDLSKPFKRQLFSYIKDIQKTEELKKEIKKEFSSFVKEKGYNPQTVSIRLSTKDSSLPVSVSLIFGSYNHLLDINKPYKTVIRNFFKECYQKEVEKEKKIRQEMKGSKLVGDIVATGIATIVMKNNKYITVNTLPKIIRGLSLDLWGALTSTEYDRKFHFLSPSYIDKTMDKMVKEKLIAYERGYSSKYDYTAVVRTKKTEMFLAISKTAKNPSNPTEFEMLSVIREKKGNLEEIIKILDYLIDHPACYCFDEKSCSHFLKSMPKEAKEYLKVRYKLEEEREVRKYIREYLSFCG